MKSLLKNLNILILEKSGKVTGNNYNIEKDCTDYRTVDVDFWVAYENKITNYFTDRTDYNGLHGNIRSADRLKHICYRG